MARFERARMEAAAASDAASDAAIGAWLTEAERCTCPAIIRAARRLGFAAALELELEAEAEAEGRQRGDAPPEACAGRTPAAADAPAAYASVLRLLREADRSGDWPSTSRARARILSVEDTSAGGSFSLRAPGTGAASTWHSRSTRGNALFSELVRAVFELEKRIAPGRPPSTMVAVNRRAQFLPHTDAGSGFGQSTSLIVGLGDYAGGELVVEGEPRDIRYAPLTFDGWRQRHWTLPFEGERFSLVWFTPSGAAPMAVQPPAVLPWTSG